jgi:hypothetical protein
MPFSSDTLVPLTSAAKTVEVGSCFGTAEAVPFPKSLRLRSAWTGWFPIHKIKVRSRGRERPRYTRNQSPHLPARRQRYLRAAAGASAVHALVATAASAAALARTQGPERHHAAGLQHRREHPSAATLQEKTSCVILTV